MIHPSRKVWLAKNQSVEMVLFYRWFACKNQSWRWISLDGLVGIIWPLTCRGFYDGWDYTDVTNSKPVKSAKHGVWKFYELFSWGAWCLKAQPHKARAQAQFTSLQVCWAKPKRKWMLTCALEYPMCNFIRDRFPSFISDGTTRQSQAFLPIGPSNWYWPQSHRAQCTSSL